MSISAIIPVYNGAAYLAAAIDSVFDQSCPPTELIVVDDGSTDDSAAIAERFGGRLILVQQANAGPAAARNVGLAQARGDYVAFLDADDIWFPDTLAIQTAHLAALGEPRIGWGRSVRTLEPGVAEPSHAGWKEAQYVLSVSSMLFPRAAFDRVGIFDPSFRMGEDLDLLIRMHDAGITFAQHPGLVCRRRLHANNLSRDEQAITFGHFMAVKRSFDRRRAADRPE